jgi:DNA-binding response OmpR family regulator
VFVLEDEILILLDLQMMIIDLGWDVPYVASDLQTAMHITTTERFDLALLDLNVKGKMSHPIAAILQERNIPFIISTGYGEEMVRQQFPEALYLPKPIERGPLRNALREIKRRPSMGRIVQSSLKQARCLTS